MTDRYASIDSFLGRLNQEETGAVLMKALEILTEEQLRESLREVPEHTRDTVHDVLTDLEFLLDEENS